MKRIALLRAGGVALSAAFGAGLMAVSIAPAQDDTDEARQCRRGCYEAYGPYGVYPNAQFLNQCVYRCNGGNQ